MKPRSELSFGTELMASNIENVY